jgi:hypothetical protein
MSQGVGQKDRLEHKFDDYSRELVERSQSEGECLLVEQILALKDVNVII